MGNCCKCCAAKKQYWEDDENVIELSSLTSSTPPDETVTVTDGRNNGDDPIKIWNFDYKIPDNTSAHYTDKYEIANRRRGPRLIIRRGLPFTVKLTFNRPFNNDKDVICLVFKLSDAKHPSYSQGTVIVLPVLMKRPSRPGKEWSATSVLSSRDDRILNVQVVPAANAIIGEWEIDVDTKLKKSDMLDYQRYSIKEPFYILFNAWCTDDTVYLPADDWKKEYLLTETGLIWRGTHSKLRPTVWNYGQFEENILECSIYLLSKIGKLDVTSRSDPVKVSRHISAIVNSQNDGGVLVGNWTGKFKGGDPPTTWAGSMKILQKYYKTKRPVKFGQCWVFAGLVTTVCRALGIPSRCVTNFCSAHDTHSSLTVDYFYDDSGEGVDKLNIDSIWNFHVWNEVWMDRPDIGNGYGGWQAIDSTPQELSDGQYRCGPSSVKAIKRGEVLKSYDVSFLYSEVNADKVYWRYAGPSQPLKLISKKSEDIGRFMSTKAIGKFVREDITDNYKFSERSTEERNVMFRALRQSRNSFSRYYLNDDFEDIEFTFKLVDDIVIGSDFKVQLYMKNKNRNKPYSVSGILRVATMLYNGRPKAVAKKEKFKIKVESGNVDEASITVRYEDYEKCLIDQGAFHISAMATVLETGFDYFAQDDFRVRKPDIIINCDREIKVGTSFAVTCFFKNPLPRKLSKGYFAIEGSGLGKPLVIKVKKSVNPGEQCKVSFNMNAESPGEKSIIAKFKSKELDDVEGYKEIVILPMEVTTANIRL